MSRILLGVSAVALAVAGGLYWQTKLLGAEITALRVAKDTAEASLSTKTAELAVAQNAARVLSAQKAEALERAKQAEDLRAAIVEGNSDALETVGGSLGDALRILRAATAVGDCEGGVGGAGGAGGVAPAGRGAQP